MSFYKQRPPKNPMDDLVWAIIKATRVAYPAFVGMILTKVAIIVGFVVGLVFIKVAL